jgi:hypothetical protein
VEHTTLRREWLDDDSVGSILHGVMANQCPKWKDIADHSPTYRSAGLMHQDDDMLLFMGVDIDTAGDFPLGNDNIPGGFSGQAASRR